MFYYIKLPRLTSIPNYLQLTKLSSVLADMFLTEIDVHFGLGWLHVHCFLAQMIDYHILLAVLSTKVQSRKNFALLFCLIIISSAFPPKELSSFFPQYEPVSKGPTLLLYITLT